MRALRFYEPLRVAVVDAPDPSPGPGEAILRVHATGLCNSDVRAYLGEKKAAAGVIPGHEVSGEVVEAGRGALAQVGDVVSLCPIVCCGSCAFCREGYRNRCPARKTLGYDIDGGIAEYLRIPAPIVAMGQLFPMDPTTPAHLRALVEPFACVLNSLEALEVRPGAPFAVVGGGPMGLLHVIAARAYGAGPILVAEPEPERQAIAVLLGADAVAHPEDAPKVGDELTKGERFPAVAVAVGNPAAIPTALALVARLGRINLFAGFPPGSSHQLDLNRLHYDEIRLVGSQNAPIRLYERAARIIPRLSGLDSVVTNHYRLADAAEAYTARLGHDGLKSAIIVDGP
ncbi:MAG: zinc-dependent alcohol dehydrogenase [Hyphomicrobiales bacterium]